MSRWDRYVLRPRVWMATSRSETVPHIGPYKRILKREFNVGDKVLLFRYRFRFSPGKLLSRWEGPFHIEEVYRFGAIKINNFEGTKPQVVNGQRLKHYMAGGPINVDVNLIHTTTHEEYVPALFQTPAGKEMCYGKETSRTAIKVPYYKFLQNKENLKPD